MKLTKTELRSQQVRSGQLQKYLPTLQLKKMLLQMEVSTASQAIEKVRREYQLQHDLVTRYASLLTAHGSSDLFPAVKINKVQVYLENIAGIDLPVFNEVIFESTHYFLLDAPVWLDAAIKGLQTLIVLREQLRIAKERKEALEKELREVSIRVNLFEKVLIPRAQTHIRKIKIFLSDQQMAAVCQAKVAKQKVVAR